MKMTVVPAQVTTVEDRIIGNLGFSQILLLVVPVFVSASVFAILPPFMGGALYKYIIIVLALLIACVLSIRIKGKIVAFWLVTLLRYNIRPKYYVFNKNTLTLRESYLTATHVHEPKNTTATTTKTRPIRPRLDIPSTALVLAALDNPAANVRFETGKKGVLHVRFTEIEEQQ